MQSASSNTATSWLCWESRCHLLRALLFSPRHCSCGRHTKKGVSFAVCPVEAEKWLSEIQQAIVAKRLDCGSAQKLAGRLTWSTQFLFHKLGRAMIKPVYAQKISATGSVGPRLLSALKWWSNVLRLKVSEDRPWHRGCEKVCRLFVDAASTPAYCAVVAFIDGKRFYTAMAPPEHLLRQLAARRDKQITSLVRIACALAPSYVHPVCPQLAGRRSLRFCWP